MSENLLLLVFGASLSVGFLLSLWLASSALDSTKSKIVERLSIVVLYLGTAGAMIVAVLTIARHSSDFGLVAAVAQFFMVGMILAVAATSPVASAVVFKNRLGLRRILLSPSVVRGVRYLTASYFLMVGLFKWITFAEYPFFQISGYNKAFYIFICAFECLCALGLLLRVTVLPVVLALSIEMIGAVYTHFHNYFANGLPDPLGNSLDAFRMLILLGYLAVATIGQELRLAQPVN